MNEQERKQFADRHNFILELGVSLSAYFSDARRYSNYINFYNYCGVLVYDWRLATMIVRNHQPSIPENAILILARSEVALDKGNSLFNPSTMKRIEETGFFAQIVKIPQELKPPKTHEGNADVTLGMRSFLLESFDPRCSDRAELAQEDLEIELERQNNWELFRFSTETVFQIIP
jgi:hypothetical protein